VRGRTSRRRLAGNLLALAAACLLAQVLTGDAQLVLRVTPLLLILALLLSGRYVAEDAIVRRWRRRMTPRRARRASSWRLPARQRSLVSLLERAPRLLRGPPLSFARSA
jgi:hypothetical protein